ncbi:hypothetical protein E2320_010528, partial [Naja naja]
SPQESPQSSESKKSQSKDGVASVYNKYGCRDSEADSSDKLSYGQMRMIQLVCQK